eukprot:1147123-Pelagomonas_calceolata.AAC.4
MPSTPPGTLQLPAVTVERVVFMGLPKKGAFQAKLPSGQVSALAAGVCHLEQWVVRCILWVAQSRGSVPSHPQASGLCGVVFGLPNMGALVTSSPSGQVEKNVQRWKLQACTCARMLMLQSNAPCLWKLYAWAKEVAGMHVCAFQTGLLHVLQRTPVFSLYFGARDNRYKRKCTPNITLTAIIGWRHISPKLKYT